MKTFLDAAASYYDFPNRLAIHYANWYRSAFLIGFLFAALAVGAALFPLALGWLGGAAHAGPEGDEASEVGQMLFALLEGGLISSVLALVYIGQRRNRWHERWVNYRIVAELLRPLGMLGLVGGRRKLPVHHRHLASYVAPARTWMVWYLRSVERLIFLPTVRVSEKHLEECLDVLEDTLAEQVGYHADNAKRYELLEARLRVFGATILGASLFACVLHVLPHLLGFSLPHFFTLQLVFVGGFFPAVGAATAGISNQAELVRVAKRSAAMEHQLAKLLHEVPIIRKMIEAGTSNGTIADRIAQLISTTADTMIHEVMDWRVVLLDRPLTPPG